MVNAMLFSYKIFVSHNNKLPILKIVQTPPKVSSVIGSNYLSFIVVVVTAPDVVVTEPVVVVAVVVGVHSGDIP